jgi:serine/threonine-protein kinase
LVEEAMHAAPEPRSSVPPSLPLPDTVLTSPAAPEPPEVAGTPESPVPEAVTPPPATAEGLPLQIGRYHLEGEIAHGGVGIVLRAHDSAFQRSLAVKVLLAKHRGKPDVARRFLEEAQVMGQLQHPGIPPVYDLGELPDGRPYFALKLIKGRTLAALLQDRQHPADDLPHFLTIFGQVCQTIAYAHSRGILHRDLKPSNIMVGAFGEVQVMDWGLAKVLGSVRKSETGIQAEEMSTIATVRTAEDDLLTQEGAVMGTPAYMAPEQARGEIERLDERADVFGLGAILCVLLTGKPPYVAPTRAEVYRQAKEAAVTDVYARLEACGADAELVRLAKGCLAPELAERPRQAGLVADAVATYQARVQERLRQAEVAQAQAQVKVAEERKRRRVTLALVVAVFLLLGGAGAAGWWHQYQQAEQAANEALRQERAVGEVKAALAEAAKLREAALKLLDNPESWQATLQAACSAVKRAQALLQQEPSLAGGAWAQQVEQLGARLAEDDKDRQLMFAFEAVLFKMSQFDRGYQKSEVYQDVHQALAQWGLPLGAVPAARATSLLQQRPRGIQDRLAAILHFCLSRVPAAEKKRKGWLQEVLATADSDPWRQQVRQAVANANPVFLAKLADKADVSQQPPAFLVELAREELLEDKPARIALLRRAQQQHPGDFWVNVELGTALYRSVFGRSVEARLAQAEELPAVNEVVAFYRVAVGLRPANAPAHSNLGTALQAQGDVQGAIACYKRAIELDPKHVTAHYNLGKAIFEGGDVKGAIACYHKALDLDPKDAYAHCNLGTVLAAQGDLKGAIECYHKALDLKPKLVQAHSNLGNALKAQGDVKEAIACFHKALDLDPKYAEAHCNLGTALAAQGDVKGAIACFKKALDLDPKLANAHNNLGTALRAQGEVKAAIACYRKALDLDPKLANAHNNLGLALYATKDVVGGIACFKQALTLDPKLVEAHINLGYALYHQEDVQGAIACYKKALALDPKYSLAHYALGTVLQVQGDLKGAIACFHKALDLDPKYAEAHCNLGHALRAQGHFTQALKALQQGHAIGSKRADWRYPSARWVEGCQHLLDLDARLPAILGGDEQPKDAAEQLALADLCQRYKKRYADAVRFYADAFGAKPKLIPAQQAFWRYDAACAATLAAAGKGEDASKLEDKEKTRLRQQALAWLRDSLQHYREQLQDAEAKTRQAVQQTLQHWQQDPDLESVRGKGALAQLPEAERAAWQQLWSDVEKLRKQTLDTK